MRVWIWVLLGLAGVVAMAFAALWRWMIRDLPSYEPMSEEERQSVLDVMDGDTYRSWWDKEA